MSETEKQLPYPQLHSVLLRL